MISLDVYFKSEENTGEIVGGQLIEQLVAKEALSADMGNNTEMVIPYHAVDIAVIRRSYEPVTVDDANCDISQSADIDHQD